MDLLKRLWRLIRPSPPACVECGDMVIQYRWTSGHWGGTDVHFSNICVGCGITDGEPGYFLCAREATAILEKYTI